MESEPTSLTIVYEESENRPTITASGAFGGPSPDGSIVAAHLFTEFGTVPSIEEHEVGAGGIVRMDKGNRIRRGDLTRQVQATLILSPEAAIRLGVFLQEQGKAAKNARNQNPA